MRRTGRTRDPRPRHGPGPSRRPLVAEAEEDETPQLLAAEYVQGLTLAEYVKDKGPLDIILAAALGIQLTEALSEIHEAGIYHRDFKPATSSGRRWDDLDGGADTLTGYRSVLHGSRPSLHGYSTWQKELSGIVRQIKEWQDEHGPGSSIGPSSSTGSAPSIGVAAPTRAQVADVAAASTTRASPPRPSATTAPASTTPSTSAPCTASRTWSNSTC